MRVLTLIPTLLIMAGLGAVGAVAVTHYSPPQAEEAEKLARLERLLEEKKLQLDQFTNKPNRARR